MSKFATLTALASLTLGAVFLQANMASAGQRTSVGNIDPNHFPAPVPHLPIPGRRGGMGHNPFGGGFSHGPDYDISLHTYGNIDLSHFCRDVEHKHKLVRVCYVP